MKKTLYFLTVASLFFGCESYNEQFDENYDENTYKQVLTDLTDTLSADDYDSFGGKIADNLAFSKDEPAANYLPDYLDGKYPTLDEGSAIKVTYNYFTTYPSYPLYTGAPVYSLTSQDYYSASPEIGLAGYFSSQEQADEHLSDILALSISGTEEGIVYLIKYKLEYEKDHVITFDVLYTYDSGWEKTEGAYYLTAPDYDSMGERSGEPGQYNNFSSSIPPENYLPRFLTLKYPYAQEEDSMITVYKYFSSGSTLPRAKKYTFTNGEWTDFNTISIKTDQYVRGNSGWAFDPTIQYTMVSADYQIIVDYVKNNINASYVSSYGNNETYYGSNAYYKEFQIGPTYYETSQFNSWEEAVKEAIGTAYLPTKYPDAVSQVDGIDVKYVINFAAYLSSMVNYSVTFQCTKSGPNPEFTYTEGPVKK